MKKRLIIFILFVTPLFFWESTVFSKNKKIITEKSYCDSNSNINYFIPDRKIENIKITFDNERKWAKNLFNALISPDKFVSNKYKKKFNASLLVIFQGEIECNFRAKIRFSGDLRDHISRIEGRIISSMDVEITENINGIKKFKLFLPHTKKDENEVFITSLLSHLGYLSARTQKIEKVYVSGQGHPYLLSESVHRKEFLEQHDRNEGPILSLDETYEMNSNSKLNNILIARIRNSKWIKGDNQKFEKSVKALTFLNYYFLNIAGNNRRDMQLISPMDGMENLFFEAKSLELTKFMKYNVLIHALGAYAHLSPGDARFYFNPITDRFEVIYNDGNSTIMGFEGKILYNLIYEDMQNFTSSLISDLKSVDRTLLIKELNEKGLKLSEKKISKLLNKIIDRVKKIKEVKSYNKKESNYRVNNFNNFIEILDNLNIGYIFYDSGYKNFQICKKSKCYKANLDSKQKQSLINQRLKIKDYKYIFIGDKAISKFENLKIKSFLDTFLKKEIDKNFFIYYNSGRIKVDKEKKIIELTQEEINSRFVIIKANIKDYKIKIKNIKSFHNSSNHLGLTGCLTFYETYFDNVYLNSEKASCEDAINIIKSKGSINHILVKNSSSDSIDIDFSKIKINKLEITNSGNDCLDLSYGEYDINIINVNNCGDKGISVGEKSKLNAKNISIIKSKISAAVKDGSVLRVDNFNAINYDTCLALYRKKNEFVGSIAYIKNNNCKKESIYTQNGSVLNITK